MYIPIYILYNTNHGTNYTVYKRGSKLRDFLDLEMLGSDVSTDSKHRYHNFDLVPCSCIEYGYSPHEMASLTKWPISYIC